MIIHLLSFLLMACGASSPKQSDTTIIGQKVQFSSLSEKAKAYYADAIRPLYEKQLLRSGFNGAILFAKNGEIVFEDYRGDINFKTKEPITPTTPFHLASISKTFTAYFTRIISITYFSDYYLLG